MIWINSIYKFIIEHGWDENEERIYKEIFIDVTDSVPSFDSPMETLGAVLDKTMNEFEKKQPLILDFGAGKLRNTLYLLQKGYPVYAVEYEKVSKNSDKAKEMYSKAQKYGEQFHRLVFPHDFFKSKDQFDLILLINVCTVMPVLSERYLVLQYCRNKLKEDGLLLWYSQHNDYTTKLKCNDTVRMGDGHYFNSTRRYQTFYRDMERHEIDAMFLSNGFREFKKYPADKNIAKLYRKIGNNPITPKILNAEIIRKYVIGDKNYGAKRSPGVNFLKQVDNPVLNDPIPEILSEERIYINALKNLRSGKDNAIDYHNLIAAIIIKLFIPPLKSPNLEQKENEGRKRIDIVMNNSACSGFFDDIINKHKIHAPYIIIECKNYLYEIGNPQIDQLY